MDDTRQKDANQQNENYTVLWISKQSGLLIISQSIRRLLRTTLGKEGCFTINHLQMAPYSSQDDAYHCSAQTTCFDSVGAAGLFIHARKLAMFFYRRRRKVTQCVFVTLVVHYRAQERRLKRFRVIPRSQSSFLVFLIFIFLESIPCSYVF